MSEDQAMSTSATVWMVGPMLVQTTVLPRGMVTDGGSKAKSITLTLTTCGAGRLVAVGAGRRWVLVGRGFAVAVGGLTVGVGGTLVSLGAGSGELVGGT